MNKYIITTCTPSIHFSNRLEVGADDPISIGPKFGANDPIFIRFFVYAKEKSGLVRWAIRFIPEDLHMPGFSQARAYLGPCVHTGNRSLDLDS